MQRQDCVAEGRATPSQSFTVNQRFLIDTHHSSQSLAHSLTMRPASVQALGADSCWPVLEALACNADLSGSREPSTGGPNIHHGHVSRGNPAALVEGLERLSLITQYSSSQNSHDAICAAQTQGPSPFTSPSSTRQPPAHDETHRHQQYSNAMATWAACLASPWPFGSQGQLTAIKDKQHDPQALRKYLHVRLCSPMKEIHQETEKGVKETHWNRGSRGPETCSCAPTHPNQMQQNVDGRDLRMQKVRHQHRQAENEHRSLGHGGERSRRLRPRAEQVRAPHAGRWVRPQVAVCCQARPHCGGPSRRGCQPARVPYRTSGCLPHGSCPAWVRMPRCALMPSSAALAKAAEKQRRRHTLVMTASRRS